MTTVSTDGKYTVETMRSCDTQQSWGSIKVTLFDGREAVFTWRKGMWPDITARRWKTEVEARDASQQWITQALASSIVVTAEIKAPRIEVTAKELDLVRWVAAEAQFLASKYRDMWFGLEDLIAMDRATTNDAVYETFPWEA